MERFSPYYNDREKFSVRNVRPEASYSYVYPSHVALDKAAYFFDYEMGDTVSPDVHQSAEKLVSSWRKCWHSDERHTLTYRRASEALLIDFNWGPERQGTYTLSGTLACMYEFCVETMHTPDQVVEYLRSLPQGCDYPVEEVREALDEYCRARLMLSEDGRYLSLALPSNPNWQAFTKEEPHDEV